MTSIRSARSRLQLNSARRYLAAAEFEVTRLRRRVNQLEAEVEAGLSRRRGRPRALHLHALLDTAVCGTPLSLASEVSYDARSFRRDPARCKRCASVIRK